MKNYWNAKLSGIANIDKLPDLVQTPEPGATPDSRLKNAYKAGYIYTHIVKDGNELKVGEEYYDDGFIDPSGGTHPYEAFLGDRLGILATLLTIGDTGEETLNYLNEFPATIPLLYQIAKWQYPCLWAIYLERTGTSGAEAVSARLHDIHVSAHQIHDDRCLAGGPGSPDCASPNGLMRKTPNFYWFAEDPGIDHWALDNASALMGLAAYKYICEQLPNELECVGTGPIPESVWATNEYNDLLKTVNAKHAETISTLGLNYLPVSMDRSNDPPVLRGPLDANWGVVLSFGRWAWDAYLLGLPQAGIEINMMDATYASGLRKGQAAVPPLAPHNFGAYPGAPTATDAYSSAYNAGYGSAALRGEFYRSEGIYAYQFSLDKGQSGPFSWFESFRAPSPVPWAGDHPDSEPYSYISCPHMWGQSTATKVLLDSLIALKGDGSVIIGRGVPNEWVRQGKVIQVSNFAIPDGGRMKFTLTGDAPNSVRLVLEDALPPGGAVLDLRAFKNNISSATGTNVVVDNEQGTVTLPPGTTTTIVTLTTADPTPMPTPVPVWISLPETTMALSPTNFTVPVQTSTINASDNLTAFKGDFTFDSTVVGFQSPAASTAGITAGASWSITSEILAAFGPIKTLRISAVSSNSTALSGSGILFNLNMTRVSNTPGAPTALVWAQPPNNFIFNNNPALVPSSAPPGSVSNPAAVKISGATTYCSNLNHAVPSVTLSATGSVPASAVSDSTGSYQLGVFPGGTYTVTPSKTALAPGTSSINTVDMITIQRHYLGIALIPVGCKRTAADVTGDGVIGTADALAVQRFFQNQPNGYANTGQYRFNPVNRTYSGVVTDQAGQNYDTLILGDVAAGFEHRPQGSSQEISREGSVAEVALPEVDYSKTGLVAAVTTSAIDAKRNLVGFQGDFTFDERVVAFDSEPVQKAGMTGGNWNVSGSVLPGPGPIRTLRVSAFSSDFAPLSGAGTLFELNILRVNKAQSSQLIWAAPPDNFIFIDADLETQEPVNAIAGSVIGSGKRR